MIKAHQQRVMAMLAKRLGLVLTRLPQGGTAPLYPLTALEAWIPVLQGGGGTGAALAEIEDRPGLPWE